MNKRLKGESEILNDYFTPRSVYGGKYVVIPGIKNPRIIIPVNSFRLFFNSLRVHNTTAIRNIIIKWMMPIAYLYFKNNNDNLVGMTANLKNLMEDVEKNTINKKIYNIAAYCGTKNSINRKYSMLLLDSECNPLGILKSPIEEGSGEYIKNEYLTLCSLYNCTYDNIILPGNSKYFTWDTKQVLYQEDIFENTVKLPNKLNDIIVDASAELGIKTSRYDFDKYSENIITQLKEFDLDEYFYDSFQQNFEIIRNHEIPVVRLHGDYVIYNMRYKNKKLHLIDWEFSRDGLPLFDLFQFIFQGKYLVGKMRVEEIMKYIFRQKNIDYFNKYSKMLRVPTDLHATLFTMYLFDSLVHSKSIRPDEQLKSNQYYRALKIIINERR